MSLDRKLDQVLSRFQEVETLLSSGTLATEVFTKLSREYAELTPLAEKVRQYKKAKHEYADLEALMKDPAGDKDMRALAEEEYYRLKEELPSFEKDIQIALLPKDAADDKNAILEIRAGTGGDEAALFALDLMGMYKRYAADRGWRFDIIEMAENDLGGIKQAVAEVSGQAVFSRLKYESGVHRVQRVPETEASGRIHTSAATVAVLPEAEDVDVEIRDGDLRIDVMRSGGAGGQHVNKTESAVRITHIPSGIVVVQQSEKSQHKNKDRAMKILRARLYEMERQRLADERSANRKEQVGSGDRSERIRTYNYPQGRVTDHRINLTLYKLDRIITGECLDEVIDPLITEDQAAKLTEMSW
jgi:peptide chain release factor 1